MDLVQTIESTARAFVDQLGIAAQLSVVYDQAGDQYQINLSCDDPGVLIGHHGESLSALQLLLGQHLKAQTQNWVNILVNVNDYRERREQTLIQLADNTVEQVIATGQAHSLPPLSAGERRIVHLHLADHPQVVTESTGDGRNRTLIISPRAV